MRESQAMQQRLGVTQRYEPMQQPPVPPAPAKPLPAPVEVKGPPANAPPSQPSLKVDFADGKLTVTADRMPLSQVLREVGQRTGLEIRGVQDAGGMVSVQFSKASVAQGMQELLGGTNYAVIGSLASAEQIHDARVIILSATSTDNIDLGGPLGAARSRQPQTPGGPADGLSQEAKDSLRAELMSSDPAQQDRGFSQINKLDPKEAFDALQDVLTNGDGIARLRALQFMDQDSSLEPNQVVGALREALNDPDNTLRDYAIQALGRQNGSDALDALRQQFEAGDAATRLSVLEAISQRSDAQSIIQEASNDPDQSVRTMATELLQNSAGQPQPGVQPPGTIQLQPAPEPPPSDDPDGDPGMPPNR
ncbi:MAG TPA: HEAT repeat domain-containing protein [Terriglobia bacterium]|nr:HEAT repeat domain-containing protein [Terriglobia bacterium]